MDKMMWSKPEMNEFAFAANEYVASCGDNGQNILFTCDAGGGAYGYVWTETTGDDWDNLKNGQGLDTKRSYLGGPVDGSFPGYSEYDDLISITYHACDIKHETSRYSDFKKGYYLARDKWNNGNFQLSDVLNVLIWRGADNDDVHCTTKLDINSWEVAKS